MKSYFFGGLISGLIIGMLFAQWILPPYHPTKREQIIYPNIIKTNDFFGNTYYIIPSYVIPKP